MAPEEEVEEEERGTYDDPEGVEEEERGA